MRGADRLPDRRGLGLRLGRVSAVAVGGAALATVYLGGRPAGLLAAVVAVIAWRALDDRAEELRIIESLAQCSLADVASPLPLVFDGTNSTATDVTRVEHAGAGRLPARPGASGDAVPIITAQAVRNASLDALHGGHAMGFARTVRSVDGNRRIGRLRRLPRRSEVWVVRLPDGAVAKVTRDDFLHVPAVELATMVDPPDVARSARTGT